MRVVFLSIYETSAQRSLTMNIRKTTRFEVWGKFTVSAFGCHAIQFKCLTCATNHAKSQHGPVCGLFFMFRDIFLQLKGFQTIWDSVSDIP